jgi:hypothetical protein
VVNVGVGVVNRVGRGTRVGRRSVGDEFWLVVAIACAVGDCAVAVGVVDRVAVGVKSVAVGILVRWVAVVADCVATVLANARVAFVLLCLGISGEVKTPRARELAVRTNAPMSKEKAMANTRAPRMMNSRLFLSSSRGDIWLIGWFPSLALGLLIPATPCWQLG